MQHEITEEEVWCAIEDETARTNQNSIRPEALALTGFGFPLQPGWLAHLLFALLGRFDAGPRTEIQCD